jgi:hypothetical protein
MREQGYSFSLADHACCELIAQRSRGAISDDEHAKLIERLRCFIDAANPVMLGEVDVLERIGAIRNRHGNYKNDASVLSGRAWRVLCEKQANGEELSGNLLDEGRTVWTALLTKVESIYRASGSPELLDELNDPILDQALASLDRVHDIDPPMSQRMDLRVRYFWRQFVRSKRARQPYDPANPKKRNDGTDFTIYTYLALPALIVAEESGFFSSIANIPSFQASWFIKPIDLANAWKRGECPRPVWP